MADQVDRRLAIDLELFSRGGLKVLEKIERQNYDVLARAAGGIESRTRGITARRDHPPSIFAGRMIPVTPLDRSYEWCTQVARSQAKNFYYSFLLLTLPQRRAMCAIYAFMRYCDDLADDESIADRAGAIARWRSDLDAALAGTAPDHELWPAFVDSVERFKIPHEYFFDMIDGVSSDLEPRRVKTFDELYDYCYHVASVVGLTIIHIFGFDDREGFGTGRKMRDRISAHQHSSRRA